MTTLTTAQKLAQALANTIKTPTYVVEQSGKYLVQDTDDICCYWHDPDNGGLIAGAQIVAAYQPRADDLPGIENEPPEPPVYPAPGGRAVTLQSIPTYACTAGRPCTNPRHDHTHYAVSAQSIQIERTMRRCHNCGADHRTWRCPELTSALFAPETPPWFDIDLGRKLCAMRWRRFEKFKALLSSLPHEHLIVYAASYQAFIREFQPDSDLTITQVLQAWGKVNTPALERAA